jgi:hypothetical protein
MNNEQFNRENAPRVHPMPVDAQKYAQNISVVNFINAYAQVRDILNYGARSVLIVGIGVGLESIILRHKYNIEVCTLDIDPGFKPDIVGSVHKMDMFKDQQFDVVVASHILEHLPFSLFDQSLSELSRVARHAIIYLPYGGRHLEWKFSYCQRVREYALRLHIPLMLMTDGESLVLQEGYHYWECGIPGFSVSKITSLLAKHFQIDNRYHNKEWKYSINFCLTSLHAK